jgi:hypothetical protein
MNMLKVFLLSSYLIFCSELHAKTLCDENSENCQEVGSAASYLLSIIETSLEPCKNSKVAEWLEEYKWLIIQVKESDREYPYLKQMQRQAFWAPENPDQEKYCLKIQKLVTSSNPLNQEMR